MIKDQRAVALAHALFHAVQDGRLPIDFDIDGTIEQLERARVVAVLDAAILDGTILSWQMTHHVAMGDFAHAIWLSPKAHVFYGSDFDAARAAAAKAIEEGSV